MSRRTTPLSLDSSDGTSQRGRALAALDPASAAIDERGHADLIAFVQAFSERLRYVEGDGEALREVGTWSAFARHDDLTIDDIVAYMADPGRFAGEAARWLGRPHFALLLAFLELLGHAREQLNGLTARHLDHHFREVLGLRPAPAVPDRVRVVFRLAPGVAVHRLPAGAELQAGRDAAGVVRIYRTERELLVSRAKVDALRSVFVRRRVTGLRELGAIRGQTVDEAFERALNLALGAPAPGDPAPRWQGRALDRSLFLELGPLLDFAGDHLGLAHHELRRLDELVARRRADAGEWAAIAELLGADGGADLRDFAGILARVVGPLDFEAAGLHGIADLDELHERRAEPEVRAFIDERLAAIGYARFDAAMAIKRRIDGEWREIHRLLERAGRRRRGALGFRLVPADPTDFAANLAAALGDAWPPPWPAGVADLDAYVGLVRALEAHLALPAEQIARLVALARALPGGREAVWPELTAILEEAYAERPRAARRAALAAARGDRQGLDGFDAVVRAALGVAGELPWEEARARLGERLDPGQQGLVDRFRVQLLDPAAPRRSTWDDLLRTLEIVARGGAAEEPARPRQIEWQNLHAHDDPSALLVEVGSPRWKTFGPAATGGDESRPPTASIGWGLSSPALALSQGRRALTLTLGLRHLDRDAFARGLGLEPGAADDKALLTGLQAVVKIEVTTAEGWIEAPLVSAVVAAGGPEADYWALVGLPRGLGGRPALQFGVVVGPRIGALVAIDGAAAPSLRVTLRSVWDADSQSWITRPAAFDGLALAALHLRVDVDGLVDLQVQHEERPLDPGRPFEPWGPRPASGARLYIGHPELASARLDALRFDLEWMGLPPSLRAHYHNYPGITGAADFKVRVSLVDRGLHLPLGEGALFREGAPPESATAADQRLDFVELGGALARESPGYVYTRGGAQASARPRDLRGAERCFLWELGARDFGHAAFPAISARASRELALALARGDADAATLDAHRVESPYTPTLRRLRAAYRASLEVRPEDPVGVDRLLHVHPFGVSTIGGDDPSLLPRYDAAGELYIGLVDVDAPQRLALLIVVADGTSDPDVEPAGVRWSIRDGERWLDLGDKILHDSTRGLINSGIVELDLPATAPSDLLPAGRTWLRVAVTGDPAGVCDMVAIHAQAVTAVFDDRGNAPEHYARPLPAASVERLSAATPEIVGISQPFTSVGGRPPEAPERFYTRVSERLRHKGRALAAWDYERLVLQRFAAIYKAKCLPAAAPRGPGAVDVLVIPDLRAHLPADAFAPRASADLLAEVQDYLQAIAPAAARVRVRNPHYVAVSVRLGVRFREGEDLRRAAERLGDDLSRFLSPWAYDEGAELTIGGRIYASSILDFVDRREYVDYVAEIRLARSDNGVDFTVLPPVDEDYHVAAERPDQVLVAARQHHIDVMRERDYQQTSFTGIDYMKVELDFILG